MTEVALTGLLHSLQPDERHQGSSVASRGWNRFESARDLAKLKKRLAHALDRLGGGAAIDEAEEEQ